MNVRIVLLVLLAGSVAGAVALLSSPPTGRPPEPRADGVAPAAPRTGTVATGGAVPASGASSQREPFTKAAQCKACHEDVYAEWRTSFHAQAWTDPMVVALSNGFRMSECIDCHAPMPIHETGIGARVAPRQSGRADGIDCLTCHLMDDGVSVAAVRAADTSATPGACRPVEVVQMGRPDACAGCHNQHNTVDELAASGRKETCSQCHMAAVDRSGRAGRSHVFPGAHDVAMHRRAAKMQLRVEDGAVVAKVTNVDAGHQIPADARHRSYNLFLSAWDERGNPLVAEKPMEAGEFRLYYRDDFRPSTQIADGKSREGRWVIPSGLKGRARVRLCYALNPEELAARKVTEVFSQEINFP